MDHKEKGEVALKKLLARRQQRLLRRWLRYVKSLRATEEMVHACEPEDGRNLSDDEEERSSRDLIDCQVGRDGLSNFQVGNRKRSSEGLVYCQEGGAESSNFQEGTKMGLTDLIDCQVGRERGETPYFQEGKGDQMRPCESLMNSEVSSDQREELIEKDQRNLLIIGGIHIFLPNSQDEARKDVAGTTTEGQPTKTIKEK
jgi:hypothetical protein